MGDAAVQRLRRVPWGVLGGLAPALDAPIAEVLSGAAAERVLDRFLRSRRDLGADGRAAVAEALFGVGLWRRRLAWHLGEDGASPRRLLASLLRDLAGVAGAERLLGLAAGTLPPPRPPPADLAVRFSMPDWLAATVEREAGAGAAALAAALGEPGPVCLRPNLLRTTVEGLAATLRAEGVETRPGRWAEGSLVVRSPRPNLHGLAAWRGGLFEVQDEGSQVVGAIVEARPGDEVLDLCAGAGGKSLQLASALRGRGRIHVADADPERLLRLRVRAERAGVGNVTAHGAEPPPGLLVDRALVDAPCSDLGALRRGPDLRFRIDPASFEPLPALQRRLLGKAARLVRPGGRLVYATCTFRREENDEVARDFDGAHPEFARVRPAVDPALLDAEGFLRTWPHLHATDAFFAAAWERRR